MTELIGIREAARRLGVSDTAVHKAIKAGRVTVAGRTPTSNRPLVAWPQTQDDWLANSDTAKRTHVGSKGSPRRAADPEPAVPLATNTQDEQPAVGGDALPGRAVQGPSLAQSRAVKEAYLARLAKLDFEQKIGKLIEADEVKVRAFKLARNARDALLTMPDRLAPVLASTTDVQEIHRLMIEDIERTCQRLADGALTTV
jgi:hypothetical protein